jgi:hypothetical protein
LGTVFRCCVLYSVFAPGERLYRLGRVVIGLNFPQMGGLALSNRKKRNHPQQQNPQTHQRNKHFGEAFTPCCCDESCGTVESVVSGRKQNA